MRRSTADFFYTKIHVSPMGGCWEWTASRNGSGYASFGGGGGSTSAHRYSYELHVGPIPEGLHIDHLCRNRGCVNPSHLEPVSVAENVRRGSWARLTKAEADEIRSEYGPPRGERVKPLPGQPSMRDLARKYNVSVSQVSSIVGRGSWS